MSRILVSGSLAYDRIMDFPGLFKDRILPDKVHALSISFLVENVQESFGGTAGNIAYTLALLKEEPIIIARAGNDFEPYARWLAEHGINISPIEIDASERTAFATIITDQEDNQITAFYRGAMGNPYVKEIPDAALAIIAAGNMSAVQTLPAMMRSRQIPFIFDPGQTTPSLSMEDLENGIEEAKALMVNDYELELIVRKTGWSEEEILKHAEILVVTVGEKGSRVRTGEKTFAIPAAKPKAVVDPTGAGDAYRAGFVAGLMRELPLETCGKLAAVVACYTVETEGTQTHHFTIPELKIRYKQNFNEALPL